MNSELNKNRQTATSVSSLVLSFLASSHHWIHMVIIMLLGGSMSIMAGTMPAIVWFRRVMVLATFLTVAFSVYRLFRHKCKDTKVIAVTVVSAVISIGVAIYTLVSFGW